MFSRKMGSLLVCCLLLLGIAVTSPCLASDQKAVEKEDQPSLENSQPTEGHYQETRTLPFLGLSTGERDITGKPVRIPCYTCHKDIVNLSDEDIRRTDGDFHKNIQLVHGAKTCHTCHKPPNFTGFNLADGSIVTYENAMQLCGQCHSRRLEEYLNGAHGGMNGYWDLNKGPRVRNHCFDCHDPHSPAIKPVLPAARIHNRSIDNK